MKCLNGNLYLVYIINKSLLCKAISSLFYFTHALFILLLKDDILKLMQWYHPYGLNTKEIVHKGWLNMVKLDKFANGRTSKPCIINKQLETNHTSRSGLILTYSLKLVIVVKSSTNLQVISNTKSCTETCRSTSFKWTEFMHGNHAWSLWLPSQTYNNFLDKDDSLAFTLKNASNSSLFCFQSKLHDSSKLTIDLVSPYQFCGDT
jgi:hypothetical protein